jgi:hypothetical protein
VSGLTEKDTPGISSYSKFSSRCGTIPAYSYQTAILSLQLRGLLAELKAAVYIL